MQYIETANSNLTYVAADIDAIRAQVAALPPEGLNNTALATNLSSHYNLTLQSINDTIYSLECDSINAYWDKITDNICKGPDAFLNQWVDIYMAQAAAIVFLSIARLCCCTSEDGASLREEYERIQEEKHPSECEVPEISLPESQKFGAARGGPGYQKLRYQQRPPPPPGAPFRQD